MTRARSPAVDTIRAAALMGICVVNLPFLGQPIEVVLAPPVGTVDTLTWIFTSTLFQSKFFLLFSFLFGWGFGAQAAAAAREGRALGPRTARRARAATWTGPKPAPPWPCLAPPGPPRLAWSTSVRWAGQSGPGHPDRTRRWLSIGLPTAVGLWSMASSHNETV